MEPSTRPRIVSQLTELHTPETMPSEKLTYTTRPMEIWSTFFVALEAANLNTHLRSSWPMANGSSSWTPMSRNVVASI